MRSGGWKTLNKKTAEMVREQLMKELQQLGIDFPETASVTQLRDLLKEVVGAARSPQAEIEKGTPEQTVKTVEGEAEERQIKLLETRLRMLKLEKEINEMEAQRAGKRSMSNFADIEGALPKFNGDDEYGIKKWITEFEKVIKVVGCGKRSVISEKYEIGRLARAEK